MKIAQFHIYSADLNPRMGTEPSKIRPVVVIQTNLLNGAHPSTLICPITSHVVPEAKILRVHLPAKTSGLEKPSDILVDQVRAIDNRRFLKSLGTLTDPQRDQLLNNLRILLFE